MKKVVSYRRAMWLADESYSLEELVSDALNACPDVEATKYDYKLGVDVQIAQRAPAGDGVGCYFTLYSEGQPAATVQNGGPHVNRRQAPDGEEFLRTGIYLIIQDNNVGYVANGHTNDGQITGLLVEFLREQGAADDQLHFALMPRADRAAIASLLDAGVKSIDLGIGAYVSTVTSVNQSNQTGGLSAALINIGSEITRIIGHDRTPEESLAAADIQARVHLGYDGRNANHLLPVLMASVGSDVVDGADEFKIMTKDDIVITRDKLSIKREMEIDGDEVALDPYSAFASIRFVMTGWRNAGLFEQ